MDVTSDEQRNRDRIPDPDCASRVEWGSFFVCAAILRALKSASGLFLFFRRCDQKFVIG